MSEDLLRTAVEREKQKWINCFREDYRYLETREIRGLPEGTEVIVEQFRRDARTGRPRESLFYRGVLTGHNTVSGWMETIHAEPDVRFPELPPWSPGWIYAANDAITTLWIKKDFIFGSI